MRATNLGQAEGLPTIEWSQVEMQLVDLLMHDDPRSPDFVSTVRGVGYRMGAGR